MYIIPINKATLDLIEVLNNGIRPEVENDPTFFIWKGKDGIPEIVTNSPEHLFRVPANWWQTKVTYIED